MPPINPIFDTKQKIAWYTAEAQMFEKLARKACNEWDKRVFQDKANQNWLRVTELREGA